MGEQGAECDRSLPPFKVTRDGDENDAPVPLCVECGMAGRCAGCYLMESRGLTPPPHVIPPAPTGDDR